ncbi:hypothetical protein LNP56_16915 [Klebsiella pneumoniae subsp. pneumoniae]|nr:hypothetical protein [Klebsiella pneumoniae subsp. pneumoniae]
MGGELESAVGFGDFDAADGLTDALVGHEIKLHIFTNGLCASAKCEG